MNGINNGLADDTHPLKLRWDQNVPLPRRWVVSEGRNRGSVSTNPSGALPFDFSSAMAGLCLDVARRCEQLAHIKMPQILVSFTQCRNQSRHGLQARVTPLRFNRGALTRRHGSIEYQVQRFIVDEMEMLYLLTFCLPRFLDQSFDEKLLTVFHELYHVSPLFDGDLRRHPGRYEVHSHSKDSYDARMAELVREYLSSHPNPGVIDFLRLSSRDLCDRYGGIQGVVVPRPKLFPIGRASMREAARMQEKQKG